MRKWFLLFTILLVLFISLRGYRLYEANQNEQARDQLEKVYYEAVLGGSMGESVGSSSSKSNVKKSPPPNVIGRIEIPAKGINYVILDKTTDQNLDISITKVVGPNVFEKGNLVIAGHNMKNGSFFGKLKNIKLSEKIILEDASSGIKKEYAVIDTYIVDETDLSPLEQGQSETLLTLITCTEKSNKRLIVKAKLL